MLLYKKLNYMGHAMLSSINNNDYLKMYYPLLLELFLLNNEFLSDCNIDRICNSLYFN